MNTYKRAVIIRQIKIDISPLVALNLFKKHSSHIFLLESGIDSNARFSYVGFEPSLEFSALNNKATIKTKKNLKTSNNIKEALRKVLNTYKTRPLCDQSYKNGELENSLLLANLPNFLGGMVGYFSYEYFGYNEAGLKFSHKKEFKDIDLMAFNNLVVFDNVDKKILIVAGVKLNKNGEHKNAQKAFKFIDKIKKILHSNTDKNNFKPLKLESKLSPRFSKAKFINKVKKAQHYIKEGDIFQVVLSNPLYAKASGNLLSVYENLRVLNPSAYMFYFCSNSCEIAGSSPETLVKLQDRTISTFALAGSVKTDKNNIESLKTKLLNDKKELAEHNMLVDLARNDLGKIAKIGSVEVVAYKQIIELSHILHIASKIQATLKNGLDCISCIDCVLPAGTLSGAPKIRAAEIINELENDSRGIYGGAIGYIDFRGDMDMCIAIRLAYKKGKKICIRSGAGIVKDSIPLNEFNETKTKAKAVVLALDSTKESKWYL